MHPFSPTGPLRRDIRLANLYVLSSGICLMVGILIVGSDQWHWEQPPLWVGTTLGYLWLITPFFSILGSMFLFFKYSAKHPTITYRGLIAWFTAFIGLSLPGLTIHLFR